LDGSTLGKNLDPVGAINALAAWGGGDVLSITKESPGGGAIVKSSGAVVSTVALRARTLVSSELNAAVIGRRRRSNVSGMVEVVCDALTMADLLRQRIASSIFAPKILDATW
jgi:hypothetical protein